MKTYTTKLGDSWDLIAYRELGGENCVNQLIQANQEYVDCYLFPAGVLLTIPEVRTPPSSTLPPWRTSP